MRDRNFTSDPTTFKIVGIIFSSNVNNIVTTNYEGKLHEMKRIMSVWRNRNITPFGKMIVIKTQKYLKMFSKMFHLLINLPDPPEQFIFSTRKEL